MQDVKPTRPVILVHGILGQRHLYWNLFAARLRRDGFIVHEAALPYSMLGDIRSAAQSLQAKVEAEAKAAGGKVDLVCHSAGGLVARYCLKFLGGERHVEHLVLLGTPHHGTYFSYMLPLARIAAQARPGSALLKELNQGGHPPVRTTNLWSPVDGIVIPAAHSQLDAQHVTNVRVDWMHHWGFLVSQSVYHRVRDALLGTSPSPPRQARPRKRDAPRGLPG